MTLPPFQDVLDRHGRDVYRVCVAVAGPAHADDCFQETMLAALAAYPRLRDPGVVRTWLLTIASRKAIDAHRRRAREPVPVAEPDAGAAPDRAAPDAALWARVRELPDKQRLAVAYRFVADLAYRDIGEAMGTSEEAARRNVFEGLRTLREQPGRRGAATATR
jgi:RNA polymerase sigma factor (sigma-70 family)